MDLLLVVVVVLLLLGALPTWSYSRDWGPAPATILFIILIIFLIARL